MSPQTDLQYIQLRDFTAGIQQNPVQTHPSLIPAPPGTANPLNTFRCRPLLHGGLGPMPASHHTINLTNSVVADVKDTTYYITGFHVAGPVHPGTISFWVTANYPKYDPADLTDPFYFFITVEALQLVSGHYRRRFRWKRIDPIAGTMVDLKSIDSTVDDAVDFYVGSTHQVGRSVGNAAAGGARDPLTTIGTPVVVMGHDSYLPQSVVRGIYMYPDPSTSASAQTNTPYAMGLNASDRIIAHQARIIAAAFRDKWAWGANASLLDGVSLHWTIPNAAATDSSATYFEGYGYIGAWGSITASDLFIVSTREGALLIQGDISSPTVRKLPSVTPTYGMETNGVVTPFGFIYGTNHHGIQLWSGGSGSESLSPNLPGDFFLSPSMSKFPVFKGQFAHWGEWIMCPYNWAYHTNTKSWWRIEDPEVVDIPYWFASPFGKCLYGCVSEFPSAAGSQPIIHSFPVDHLASSYKWQSQVIVADSINRLIKARELNLLADGPGTITVTLTAIATSISPVEFELHNNGPELQSAGVALDISGGMVVTIEADSGSSAPAPLMLDLSVGYQPQARAVA